MSTPIHAASNTPPAEVIAATKAYLAADIHCIDLFDPGTFFKDPGYLDRLPNKWLICSIVGDRRPEVGELLLPQDGRQQSGFPHRQAILASRKFVESHDIRDIEMAVALSALAVKYAHVSDLHAVEYIHELATNLSSKWNVYEDFAEGEDRDADAYEAVEWFRKGAQTAQRFKRIVGEPPQAIDWLTKCEGKCFKSLGDILKGLYDKRNEHKLLLDAVDAYLEAEKLFSDCNLRAHCRVVLGNAYHTLYIHDPILDHLDDGILVFMKALEDVKAATSLCCSYLEDSVHDGLGALFVNRYGHSNHVNDLNSGVEYLNLSLTSTNETSSDYAAKAVKLSRAIQLKTQATAPKDVGDNAKHLKAAQVVLKRALKNSIDTSVEDKCGLEYEMAIIYIRCGGIANLELMSRHRSQSQRRQFSPACRGASRCSYCIQGKGKTYGNNT